MKNSLHSFFFFLILLSLVTCAPPAGTEGDLKGSVQCSSGGPAAGALISLQPGIYSATTDTSGAFVIANIPESSYTATIELNGIMVRTIDNILLSGQKTTDMGVLSISCSQPCASNAACSSGSYCAKTTGFCFVQGTCTVRPQLCTALVDPVCGCDGKTYSNDCEAAAAGMSVASRGACAPPPAAGCASNSECAALEYCSKTMGTCNGTGTCKLRPTICLTLYDPVVGCDGMTYGNSCQAAQAGVNLP